MLVRSGAPRDVISCTNSCMETAGHGACATASHVGALPLRGYQSSGSFWSTCREKPSSPKALRVQCTVYFVMVWVCWMVKLTAASSCPPTLVGSPLKPPEPSPNNVATTQPPEES